MQKMIDESPDEVLDTYFMYFILEYQFLLNADDTVLIS